jgi:pimeloyl-ACP methyl ester carboxylesterase
MSVFSAVRRRLERPVPVIWALPVIALAVVVAFGYFSSSVILKVEHIPSDFNPKTFGYDYERFSFETADRIQLEGWFVPARRKSSATVIALHGWGANRGDILGTVIPLAEHFNLAVFDFRNHGASEGELTSLTSLEVRDFEAAVQFLRAFRPEQTQALGVVGFSMGGAVALSGSARIPEIRAVVAESPFSSFNGIVRHFAQAFYHVPGPLSEITLWFSRFRLGLDPEVDAPIRHIAKIAPRPLLIIQGDNDPRMKVSEGQALYDAAGEPKELWVVPGAEHIGARLVSEKEYDAKLLAFFRKGLGE